MIKFIAASQIATLALLGVVVIRVFPGNHTGYDIRYLHLSWLIALAATLLAALAQTKSGGPFRLGRPMIGCLALCLATAAAIWATDYFNIIVQYDLWLRRGMPDSPLRSSTP